MTALAMVVAGLLFRAGVNPWVASLVAIAVCEAGDLSTGENPCPKRGNAR